MNTTKSRQKNVFYIPAGIPFVNALAQAILSGNLPNPGGLEPRAHELPLWKILLPTRRATRALMQAFVGEADHTARLLPNIQPLGDVDEDELALSDMSQKIGLEPIPAPISGLERQFILYGLIHDWAGENSNNQLSKMLSASSVHAFDLARSLGNLVDSFETNQIDLAMIELLFDGEFAEHRQQILDFLTIVQKQLPEKITNINKIGTSNHRNRLMRAYKIFLESGSSSNPIIAAGSTGSIPATADSLSCIAGLEHGAVVLPGLDKNLDDESWNCLPENHPQFGMFELLSKIGIERDDVTILPGIENLLRDDIHNWRAQNWLASEIMRPAETTDQWRTAVTDHRQTLCEATKNVTVLKTEDQNSEALAIALVMRHGLEIDKTVALITPDRQLARNVKTELARWEIEIDDSAGSSLLHAANAVFLCLLLEAARDRFSPVTLKALLFHRFASFGTPQDEREDLFANFEIAVLRSEASYSGLESLRDFTATLMENRADDTYAHPAVKRLTQEHWQAIIDLTDRLILILKPLAEIFDNKSLGSFSKYLDIHLQTAEKACEQTKSGQVLWQGDDGEALSELFAGLHLAAPLAPQLSARDYKMVLERQLSEAIVRPKFLNQNSLTIYGLLEARLISPDIVIMGGLNETIWPQSIQVDPWLTRPQLQQAGLPVPERRIGLAAHDFAQGFCASKVFLSYSKKMGTGPAVPSRWILRLNALLVASGAKMACDPDKQFPWLEWAKEIDKPSSFNPVSRPSPTPPVAIRPKGFSVTGIDALLKNPYAFYADKVLRLKPLNLLEKQSGAAERGSLVHNALENFVKKHPDKLPKNASEELQAEFQFLLDGSISDPSLKIFWRPQFIRMADWFVNQEDKFRQDRLSSKVEISGQYSFKVDGVEYQLRARADRLDILDNQTYRILDYKTGEPPSFDSTAKSFSPQLLLEALIANKGGFDKSSALPVSELIYVKLSGGVPAGKINLISNSSKLKITESMDDCETGLNTLIYAYGQIEQPYLARPEPERVGMEREYDYLSRWREWAHLLNRSSSKNGRSENE